MSNQQPSNQQERDKLYAELVDKIHYSNRYNDDIYEYRHVILPKQLLKFIPKEWFTRDGCLRLLEDREWRLIGITQSMGWEHYEIHSPEPHVLLFRRELDYQNKYLNGKPAI